MAQNTRWRSADTVNPWPERVLRQVIPVRREVQRSFANRAVRPYASTLACGSSTVSVTWMRRPRPVSASVTARSLPPRQSQRTVGGVCLSEKNAQPSLPLGERNIRSVADALAGAASSTAARQIEVQRRHRAMAWRSLYRPGRAAARSAGRGARGASARADGPQPQVGVVLERL